MVNLFSTKTTKNMDFLMIAIFLNIFHNPVFLILHTFLTLRVVSSSQIFLNLSDFYFSYFNVKPTQSIFFPYYTQHGSFSGLVHAVTSFRKSSVMEKASIGEREGLSIGLDLEDKCRPASQAPTLSPPPHTSGLSQRP